jgi:hypothetical protein
MHVVRRLAVVLVAVLALSACGSSGHKTASDEDQIKSAYERFFSPKSSIPDRVAVLQDGPRFKALVTSFANDPLAKNVNVKVSSVTLQEGAAAPAKVVYTVKLGGTSLPTQTGTAVQQNGTWKVGFASLCRLVGLAGSTPAACKK